MHGEVLTRGNCGIPATSNLLTTWAVFRRRRHDDIGGGRAGALIFPWIHRSIHRCPAGRCDA